MPVVVRIDDPLAEEPLAAHARGGRDYAEPLPLDRWGGSKADIGVVLLPLKS